MIPALLVLLVSCTQPSGQTLFSNMLASSVHDSTGYQPCYETESVQVPVPEGELTRLQLRLVSTSGPVECVWKAPVPTLAQCCLPPPRGNDCVSVTQDTR